MKTALVVYNPLAGRRRAEQWAEAAREDLTRRGLEVECLATEAPRHATELAAASDPALDLLVVVGGDGTLREAAEGLADGRPGETGARRRRTVLGLVPLGNANVIARELGIPLEPAKAIEVLTSGKPRALDAARANGRLLLAMLGIGYDALVVTWVDAARRRAGWRSWYRFSADSLYAFIGLAAMIHPVRARFRVDVDGEVSTVRYCDGNICNVRTYAKGWSLTPEAVPDDGLLDVQARKRGWLPFGLLTLLYALRRRTLPRWLADSLRGERLRIEASRPVHWQIDGDPMPPAATIEVAVLPAYLRLVAP